MFYFLVLFFSIYIWLLVRRLFILFEFRRLSYDVWVMIVNNKVIIYSIRREYFIRFEKFNNVNFLNSDIRVI